MNFYDIKQWNKWLNCVGASDIAVKHRLSATVQSCWYWAAWAKLGPGCSRSRSQHFRTARVGGFAPCPRTLSSKIHGMLSIVVDLHRLRQSLRIAPVALSRHVAAFGAEKHAQSREPSSNSGPFSSHRDDKVQFLTCHDPCPPDGTWPWTPPAGRSRQELE